VHGSDCLWIHAYSRLVTLISTVVRDVMGIMTPYTVDVGVVWVCLILLCTLPKRACLFHGTERTQTLIHGMDWNGVEHMHEAAGLALTALACIARVTC